MNKRQKEVLKGQLEAEKAVLEQLEKQYKKALNDINLRIKLYQSDELTQSRIYHIQYQKALKKQVEAALEKLHSDEFSTIQQYLSSCYTDGFVGTMYDIAGQGIPVIAPIDQDAAIKAVMTDSRLNKSLYEELGIDVNELKKAVSAEITRGIATGQTYEEIARNISFKTRAPLSRANAIARTESHRIQQASAEDARQLARDRGADVVKQWDGTLDGKTRDTHRRLDGQIREVNEKFTIGTMEAMYPGDFGDPGEDCNCRCVALTRAKWALDDDELQKLKARAAYFKLDKKDTFKEFENKYLKAAETLVNTGKSGIIEVEIDELTPCLRRVSDGKIVNTVVVDVKPDRTDFKDWEFDWTTPIRNGFTVRGIKAEGDDRLQGLVALKPDPKNYAVHIDIVESAPFNNPHNKLFKQKEYTGVGGHLFAEAVRESIEQGYGGFVYFKAKTNLVEYYSKELGAVLLNPKDRIMAIDEEGAKKLYERYYQTK